MKITIQKLRRRDFNSARKFAAEGMHLTRYTSNKVELYFYSLYVLFLELTKSSQVHGAYIENNLVGILFARFKGEEAEFTSPIYKIYCALIEQASKWLGYEDAVSTYNTANQQMLAEFKKHHQPDGEITFLAVDPKLKSKGIGTVLLKDLERMNKGRFIYLYTDSSSTFQFYLKRGFDIAGQKELKLPISGESQLLTSYLFSKKL